MIFDIKTCKDLKKKIEELNEYGDIVLLLCAKSITEWISMMPTDDVVEVVRCKDAKGDRG